jgi:hypothetical protein
MNFELTKRAFACKRWRWMAGMLVNSAGSIYRIPDEKYAEDSMGATEWWLEWVSPVFYDHATLGCLLALVREAWGDQRIHILPTTDGGWAVADGDDDWICTGTTEAEALVAALEAAP